MRDYIGKRTTVTSTTLNYVRPRYHLPLPFFDTTSKGRPIITIIIAARNTTQRSVFPTSVLHYCAIHPSTRKKLEEGRGPSFSQSCHTHSLSLHTQS